MLDSSCEDNTSDSWKPDKFRYGNNQSLTGSLTIHIAESSSLSSELSADMARPMGITNTINKFSPGSFLFVSPGGDLTLRKSSAIKEVGALNKS